MHKYLFRNLSWELVTRKKSSGDEWIGFWDLCCSSRVSGERIWTDPKKLRLMQCVRFPLSNTSCCCTNNERKTDEKYENRNKKRTTTAIINEFYIFDFFFERNHFTSHIGERLHRCRWKWDKYNGTCAWARTNNRPSKSTTKYVCEQRCR